MKGNISLPPNLRVSNFLVLHGLTPGPPEAFNSKVILLCRKGGGPEPYLWCVLQSLNHRVQLFVPGCPADDQIFGRGAATIPAWHYRLPELWLHSREIRDAGVKAIAASPHLANLGVLDLSANWTVGHAAAVALFDSPYLKRIRYLDLWRCERLTRALEQMLRVRFRSRVNFQRSY